MCICVCTRTCIIKKKKGKKNDGRPRTALHNLSYIVKVSYFRASLSARPPLFTRNATAVEAEVIPTHPHTHIIYNTHIHTHRGARSQYIYIYIYTEIVSLSVFVCIYLNVISAVLNMRLYRAASSFAQHARPRTRRTHPPLGRRRFSSLTPYCTPQYT
jgi:hypothetical protein